MTCDVCPFQPEMVEAGFEVVSRRAGRSTWVCAAGHRRVFTVETEGPAMDKYWNATPRGANLRDLRW